MLKILEGELVESRYAWPEENQMKQSSIRGMSKLSESRMQTNNVLYINGRCLQPSVSSRVRDSSAKLFYSIQN